MRAMIDYNIIGTYYISISLLTSISSFLQYDVIIRTDTRKLYFRIRFICEIINSHSLNAGGQRIDNLLPRNPQLISIFHEWLNFSQIHKSGLEQLRASHHCDCDYYYQVHAYKTNVISPSCTVHY